MYLVEDSLFAHIHNGQYGRAFQLLIEDYEKRFIALESEISFLKIHIKAMEPLSRPQENGCKCKLVDKIDITIEKLFESYIDQSKTGFVTRLIASMKHNGWETIYDINIKDLICLRGVGPRGAALTICYLKKRGFDTFYQNTPAQIKRLINKFEDCNCIT